MCIRDRHIVYRRSEEELPARVEEVHHAKEEGIIFDLLTNPIEILSDDKGWVTGMKCIRMELGEPDESGRRRPVEVPGSEFVMELDTVIMSLGTSPNPLISSTTKGLDTNKWKCIIAVSYTHLIIGILHLKDAMRFHISDDKLDLPIAKLDGLLREPYFVPQTKNIDELFKEMQSQKLQMVIVVDEYGQTDGLIAMEDILEEIVGNIMDEYDEDQEHIKNRGKGE